MQRLKWWFFKRRAQKRCSVSGCQHKGALYTFTVPAFAGLAWTKRLVVLCPQHKVMVERQSADV